MTWRCFHCDETFTDAYEARLHFGKSEHSQPICQIDAAKVREMELMLDAYRQEDTELHRCMWGMQCSHRTALVREEEKGYAKGLRDGMREAVQVDAPLPPMVEPVIAEGVIPCEDCDGVGIVGQTPGNYFEPPEHIACDSCGGSGKWKGIPLFTDCQMREYVLADRRQRAAEQPDTQQPQSVYQTEPSVVCTVQTALPMALVPREPTPEMMTAVDDAYGDGGDFEDMWRAAIAAAPAAGNQSAREAFEAWLSDSGEYPLAVQRNGEGYYLMQAQSAWAAWDAAWRAYRAAHATGAAA